MKKSADTTFKAPVFGKRTKFLIAPKEWSKLEKCPTFSLYQGRMSGHSGAASNQVD